MLVTRLCVVNRNRRLVSEPHAEIERQTYYKCVEVPHPYSFKAGRSSMQMVAVVALSTPWNKFCRAPQVTANTKAPRLDRECCYASSGGSGTLSPLSSPLCPRSAQLLMGFRQSSGQRASLHVLCKPMLGRSICGVISTWILSTSPRTLSLSAQLEAVQIGRS